MPLVFCFYYKTLGCKKGWAFFIGGMMNDFFTKTLTSIKQKWEKWQPLQKGILLAIVVAVIVGIIFTVRFSARPTDVPVVNIGITDETAQSNIAKRLEEEQIKYTLSNDGKFMVKDVATARRARSILIAENLLGSINDPFALFDVKDWSRNDFKDQVQWKRSIQNMVKQHIESLSDIMEANVTINIPQEALFAENQTPTTASITIRPAPNSDIATNKKKVRALQNLILKAVDGLSDENITILDSTTNEQINDFAGMQASEEVDIIAKQQKLITKMENEYRVKILNSLWKIFTSERVQDLNIKFEMDMSKLTSESTIYTPIIRKVDNPDTPYDDSDIVDTLPISSETVTNEWQGTGYNPEGPAGVEGQNPPVYSDMSNVIGKSKQTGVKQNNVINTELRKEEKVPMIERRTVSVNIDGVWNKVRDDKGNPVIENGTIKREYVALTKEEKDEAEKLVRDAIGFERTRGDSVTVTNIQVDRRQQFEEENDAYFAAIRRQRMILYSLVGVALVMIVFVIFRVVSRELERRRRQKEEEILRQQQLAREAALREANEEGMEVSMTVEERRRVELQENAIAMAKEHPEDVAMLLRTWLSED